MARLLTWTRYLILLPVLGLALAAAAFFILGGFGLLRLLAQVVLLVVGRGPAEAAPAHGQLIVQTVEYVHTFLIGTVLYITAIGLYQLFIEEIAFVGWLKIESTEELETNLIGVTVVVLAVTFMGTIVGGTTNLLQYGGGIALPIAALGVFIGLRAWADRLARPGNPASDERASTPGAEAPPADA